MSFFTQYSRPKPTPEINSGEIIVEKSGYISAQKQIEALIDAGERLNASRLELYDYPDGLPDGDDGQITVTRNANFDMADASQIQLHLAAKGSTAQVVDPGVVKAPEVVVPVPLDKPVA